MKAAIRDWCKTVTKFIHAYTRPKSSEVRLVYASPLFDSIQICGQKKCSRPGLLENWKTARFLFLRRNHTQAPGAHFDPVWYAKQYSDVAASNIHPFLHYIKSGRLEGRLPEPSRAANLDSLIWRGNHHLGTRQLHLLLEDASNSAQERCRAHWALCRWYIYDRQYAFAFAQASALVSERENWEPALCRSYFLLCIDAAINAGEIDSADSWLSEYESALPEDAEQPLVRINIEKARGKLTSRIWQEQFNRLLAGQGVSPVSLSGELDMHYLHATPSPAPSGSDFPLVSVVIPLFNAASTICYVLRCLNAQSWPNLEIIISDDASSDGSVPLAKRWITENGQAAGRKWIVLEAQRNEGAYAVRNRGMQEASGEMLTVNDADDWAHPEKIAAQVKPLLDSEAVASVSSMVRTLPDLSFHCWRLEDRWIFRNVSSLMISRTVLETVGYWDEIKAGADTEYYYRLLKQFGSEAVVHVKPAAPLSLQLVREGSLTQSAHTHMVTQFEGPRKWYLDAAFAWHDSKPEYLYLAAGEFNRPFYCPDILKPLNQVNPVPSRVQKLQQSAYWDPTWYTERYADLHEGSVDPEEHFLKRGECELRDPGPSMSASGTTLFWNIRTRGELASEPAAQHPELHGVAARADAPAILLVGHQAGQTIYGAERSLLDLAHVQTQAGYNVYVLLPEALNEDYITNLLAVCCEVKIIPYGWWYAGKQPHETIIQSICEYLSARNIALMHINTLVLDEPLVAASRAAIPFIVHVREDLPSDPALQRALLCEPEDAHEHIIASGGHVLCNSQYMKSSFTAHANKISNSISYLYNALDMKQLLTLEPVQSDALEVGIISSNVKKKGIVAFFEIAQLLRDKSIRFNIYGPQTSELQNCLRKFSLANVHYHGYADTAAAALAKLDVVLSLSQFNESFGRTIAEAQAAGRVAISYDKGAPCELIEHGQTGYLVKSGDTTLVAELIASLATDHRARQHIGHNARHHAQHSYSYTTCANKLSALYNTLIQNRREAGLT